MRRSGAWALLLLVVLGLVWLLGWSDPIRRVPTSGDLLGPTPGENVGAYLARSAAALRSVPDGDSRWALVSPSTEWTTAATWERLGGSATAPRRLGRVLVRVPIPAVATPTVTVTPGQSADGLAAVDSIAAQLVPGAVAPDARGAAIARVCAARLRVGVPAVVGAVVLGTGAQLRAIAGQPGVRGVQPLPDGADHPAVAPLLPEFTEVAEPMVDTAPVPIS
jgi:hypothetical protein